MYLPNISSVYKYNNFCKIVHKGALEIQGKLKQAFYIFSDTMVLNFVRNNYLI